jgi:hypothetical protein
MIKTIELKPLTLVMGYNGTGKTQGILWTLKTGLPKGECYWSPTFTDYMSRIRNNEPPEVKTVYLENRTGSQHIRRHISLVDMVVKDVMNGCTVVIEDNSPTLLLALQVAVARNRYGITCDKVALYWFGGDETVTRADLNEYGSYGDFPVDYNNIIMELQLDFMKLWEAKEEAKKERNLFNWNQHKQETEERPPAIVNGCSSSPAVMQAFENSSPTFRRKER